MIVVWLFLAVPWGCLQFVIVVFPDHAHFLFLSQVMVLVAQETWDQGYKTFFSYSTQLSTKFILLINVKMPTIVGILTFISMINTTSERLKARIFLICRYFSFYEQLKFRAQLS